MNSKNITWTKDAELTALDELAARLGADSYLGPWLLSVRHELERDMRSDLAPTASLGELRTLSNDLARRHLEQDEREKALRTREGAVASRERAVDYREGNLERTRSEMRTIAARLAA